MSSRMDRETLRQWIRHYIEHDERILASGSTSQVFVNLKRALLNPPVLKAVLGFLEDDISQWLANHRGPVVIAGPALGAAPLIYGLLAGRLNYGHMHGILTRHHFRTGKFEFIDSKLSPIGITACPAIVVDDVVTSGESIAKCISELKYAGYEPRLLYSVVDRQEKRHASFVKWEPLLASLFTLDELLRT